MFDFLKFVKRRGETEKQRIGRLGEDEATRWLKKEGFKIIERNYWKPWGEIDIIAQKGQALHFVEVKTVCLERGELARFDRYEPEDNIHPWKLKRLSKAVESYLLEKYGDKDEEDPDWQMDALCLYLEKGSEKVLKIEYLEEIG
ncbi:MAG TPA: YraN family protein [Candidatus Paceibacterota bacterium]|jgi:putative endonuclease|nr:YraN family protein [Candidatus Paceibacterota bacterium]HQI26111.1 YraN family protein [Candidatus Paceibacterota bacterium]